MNDALTYLAGGITLGIIFFFLGPLDNIIANHKQIKLRELEVREQEAKARIAEAQRPRS